MRLTLPAKANSLRVLPALPVRLLPAVCVPLLAALAIAKACAYGWWLWWDVRFPAKWALVSFYDFLFVLGWGLAGLTVMALTHPLPRVRPVVRWAWVGASACCVFYGVVNIWVYHALRMPLTYPLLMMAGDITNVRSSLGSFVSPGFVLAAVGAPVAYLAMVYLLMRSRWAQQRRVYLTLAVVVAIYVPAGAFGYARWMAGGRDHALAQSPHWTLLESYVAHWRGDLTPALQDTGMAAYRDDFRPVGDRSVRPATAAGTTPIRNVIVVVLESTGTQFLSVYGSSYQTTPHLEAEAANSLVFGNFYSNAGYTLQSMMPLVLSLYPGTEWKIYASISPHLSGTSLAEVLHHSGYRTAFMTSQGLDYQGIRHFYENRGFDVVEGFEEFQKQGVGTALSSWGMDDPPMFDGMLKWIDQAPGKPFYLMAWTQQSHHPYPAAPGQRLLDLTRSASGAKSPELNRYLNAVHLADEQLGRLFAGLRERGLADSTLVVITGDHGEGFGFPHPWLFHGTALYQEGVNVPLILWNPKLFNPGRRSDAVGAHVDLNPTIADLLGISPPAAWQGTSLLDPQRPGRCYFTCNTGNLLLGMREGNQKFIYNVTEAREELYDLSADPTEQNNLAPQQPDRCRVDRQRLAAWAGFERQHLKSLVDAATAP